MSEAHEVARSMLDTLPVPLRSFTEASSFVRLQMGDESVQVVDNVAWHLWQMSSKEAR